MGKHKSQKTRKAATKATPTTTTANDPWVHKGDVRELSETYTELEDTQRRHAPFLVRLIDIGKVRQVCQCDDIPDNEVAELLAKLHSAFWRSIIVHPEYGSNRIDDYLDKGVGTRERTFYEHVLMLPDQQRENSIHYSAWEPPNKTPLGLDGAEWKTYHTIDCLESLLNLKPRVLLAWVVFNCGSAFRLSCGEDRPRLSLFDDSSDGVFRPCLCFCCPERSFFMTRTGSVRRPPEMAPTVCTVGALDAALEQLHSWRNKFCYLHAEALYPAVQERLAAEWVKHPSGRTKPDPIAQWLCDPNPQTKRAADLFLASMRPEKLAGGREAVIEGNEERADRADDPAQPDVGTTARPGHTSDEVKKKQCPVQLRGLRKSVMVLGNEKPALGVPFYEAVKKLVDVYPDGITLDLLLKGTGGARQNLHKLCEQDADWAAVLLFPGNRGKGGYRLVWPATINE